MEEAFIVLATAIFAAMCVGCGFVMGRNFDRDNQDSSCDF